MTLTHRNLIANVSHKALAVGLNADDVWLGFPPFFHVAGVAPILSLFALGGSVVCLPAFDPTACLDALARHRATFMIPVPTMLSALSEEQLANPRDVSRMRVVGVSVKVVDRSGAECDRGAIGEVLVSANSVAVGYFGQPDATAAAFVDGWYRTGDLGWLDAEANLFLADRAKDMIVSGGENVYSIEVEDALVGHDDVVECAVFGIPHERWGEAVHAVVVTRGGTDYDVLVGELLARCRATLGGFKVPKSIEVRRDALPKSGPGKVLKRALREPHWTGHGRSIA